MTRMRNGGLLCAFERWRERRFSLVEAHVRCLKIVQRWTNMDVAPAFMGWHELCVMAEDQRGPITQWLSFTDSRSDEMVSKHFHSWAVSTRHSQEARFKANKIVSRMKNMAIAIPFHMWYEQVSEVKPQQRAAKALVSRLQNLSIALTFTAWHDNLSTQRRMARAATKIAARWQHLTITAPFASWHNKGVQGKRRQRAAIKVIQRWNI